MNEVGVVIDVLENEGDEHPITGGRAELGAKPHNDSIAAAFAGLSRSHSKGAPGWSGASFEICDPLVMTPKIETFAASNISMLT